MSEQRPAPVDYWKPGAALRRYVSAYHRYCVAMPPGTVFRDVFFPSWATVRIALPGSDDWSVRLGTRNYEPVPAMALFGPSSHAGYLSCTRGTLVGVGLLPLGWATLFGGDAARLANRVVPLEQLDPGCDLLTEALADGEDPVAAFDAWLGARLALRAPPDPRIEPLFRLIESPATRRAEEIAEALEVTPRALAALTRYHFGFTPKLLLRRARFLRALSGVLARPAEANQLLEEAGYWDRSHFLRDSHLFLGCSIREFNKRRGPLNGMAMRVRETVVGAPV